MIGAAQYTLDLCARIAAITDVPATTTRLFLSPATREVHALLTAEMNALGMTVRTDSIGNLRGIYLAAKEGAPILLMGSHIDTVPDAGKYDGVLGVALPLALLRALERRRLPYAVEVIAFSEEEGIRFKLPFLGSRALVGTLGPADLLREDAQGISVAQAVRDFGLDPDWLADAAMTPGTFAFFEVHIEQGPVLEASGLPLGVVNSIVGQSRYELTFHGQANHAGTTPMHLRKDALAAAAGWLPYVESHAASDDHVATIGAIHAYPGAANIIPGKVVLTLDVRHPEDAERIRTAKELVDLATLQASKREVSVEVVKTSEQASVAMDKTLVRLLGEAAAEAGVSARPMHSGAGHDAMIVAGVVPAAMLFVRTPGGLSHHPEEAVLLEDVAAALEVCLRLLETVA